MLALARVGVCAGQCPVPRSSLALARRLSGASSPGPSSLGHGSSGPSSPTARDGGQGSNKIKVMFFGTDDFAVESLRALHSESLLPGGAVAGLEVTVLAMRSLTPAVTAYSSLHSLPLHPWPPDPAAITKAGFHLGVVASFGRLLPAALIDSSPLGVINVHGSLLPRWRGAAPVIHALAAGDTETGVSVMRVRPRRFDIGEVLAQRRVAIGPTVARKELTAQLAGLGAQLLLEVVRDFPTYSLGAAPQALEGVTLAPLVTLKMAALDFSALDSGQVYDLWRALGDVARLRCVFSSTGQEVRLATCHPPATTATTLQLPEVAAPGSLRYLKLGKSAKFLCVRCRSGWAAFTGIYHGNRKEMSPVDFHNGFLSKPGDHRLVPCPPPLSAKTGA